MQIIKTYAARIFILAMTAMFAVSCSTKAKFRQYDAQISAIQTEVRNIRVIADQMNNELVTLKTSVNIVGENISQQAKDIDAAKQHQQQMADVLDSLKSSVVKLESKTLPEKREELTQLADAQDKGGVTILSRREDGIMMVNTLRNSDTDVKSGTSRKYVSGNDIDIKKVGFGYAVKDGVILWGTPSKDAEVEEVMIAWQQMAILGTISRDGVKWLKVKTADYTGFVNSKDIIVSE